MKMARRKSIRAIAEEFAERDDISDPLWDVRGQVCKVMKEKNYIDPDDDCSEKQGTIDAVIRRLIELV